MPGNRLRLAAVAMLASATLSACSDESPLSSDFNLVGTEPFWAMQISKEANTAKFSRPGESELEAGYPVESRGEGGTIVLTSTSPEGDIVMTLTRKECSDGMSDRKYPWEASVAYKGQTLKGCAASREFMKETAQ